MTQKPESALLERRTHAMAIVLLTSRDDLTVMDVGDGAGIDLLVSIRKNKVQGFEQFGVILKGTIEEAKTDRVASPLLNSMLSRRRRFEPISMPICVFLFSMVGDRGYYAWLYEPTTNDGLPKLRRHANP
jgi:hypothetical protein